MTDAVVTPQAVRARLRLEQFAGVSWLPLVRPSTSSGRTGAGTSVRGELVEPRTEGLAQLAKAAAACRACRLCEGRRTVVFGEGDPAARLLFVGEGPGAEEDLQGRPFVGPAGMLLTKMIQALKLTRGQVYIANAVKCRPPNNRPPQLDELAACRRYLDAQLALIRPRVVCALGRTAANALLSTEQPLGALRGRPHAVGGIPVIVTYHPAHLLRHPEAKRDAWADLQRLFPYLREDAS